jgi:hypothetical protein
MPGILAADGVVVTRESPAISAVVSSIGREDPGDTLDSIAASASTAGAAVELVLVWQAEEEPPPLPGARVVRIFPCGLSYARNRGVAAATAPIVGFVDDDEVVDAGWVGAVLDGFARHPELTGLFGPVAPRDDRGLAYCYHEGGEFVLFELPDTPPWLVGTGGNMAFVRERLVAAGAFDALFGPGAPALAADDHEAIVRLLRGGALLANSPDMVVYHPSKTAEERLASRYPYGYSAGKVARRHRDVRLAARYARNTSQLIVGSTLRGDRRRRREGLETMRGFVSAALVRSKPLSPPKALARLPGNIRERLDTVPAQPLPLRLGPDPHYLYRFDERILHLYVNPPPPLRRALEDRERIRAATALRGIPRLDALGESTDALWVLEERLGGTHPRPEAIGSWFPAVAEWSVALAGPGGTALGETDGWAALREQTLAFCPEDLRAALERSFDDLAALPSRHAHGDFEPKNVLLGSAGEVGVLDWEFLRPHGLPGRDLIFLSVMAEKGRPDASIVLRLAAAHDVPWGSVRPYLRRAGLPDDALRSVLLLLLVLWAAHERHRLDTPGRTARDTPYRELLEKCAPQLV